MSLIFPLGEKHQIHRISRKAKPVAELLDSDTSVYDNNTAISTGFMALGMMLPGMASGWIQEQIGYQHFFIWVMICCIPLLATQAFTTTILSGIV